jgi:hypothetical protein
VEEYARSVADASFSWYRIYARRTRLLYRISEVVLLFASAALPVASLFRREPDFVGTTLAALVFVTVGLRGIFRWQENYLRYSQAREAVEAERRTYRTMAPPYDNLATRDQELVKAITRIEQDEMGGWLRIYSASGRSAGGGRDGTG